MAKNSPMVNAIDACLGGDDYVEDLMQEQADMQPKPKQATPARQQRTTILEEGISETLIACAKATLRVWLETHAGAKLSAEAITACVDAAAIEEIYSSWDVDNSNSMNGIVGNSGAKIDPADPRGSCEYRVLSFVKYIGSDGVERGRSVTMRMSPNIGGW